MAGRSDAQPAEEPGLAAALRVALDSLATPVFVLRSDCAVVYHNEEAATLLHSGGAFRIGKGRLVARRARDDAVLVETVPQVCATGMLAQLRFISRTDEASILLRVAPVPGQPLVVVSLAELRVPLLLDAGWSRRFFGFSASAASLAEALADGATLASFAESTGLPIGTVRTRLKKLLQQTGTSSQSALVGLLLRGAALRAEISSGQPPAPAGNSRK